MCVSVFVCVCVCACIIKIPGGGHGNPLQYPFLENPTERGTWWATVHRVCKKSSTTETREHAGSLKQCVCVCVCVCCLCVCHKDPRRRAW